MTPHYRRIPARARKIRGRLRNIFNLAIALGTTDTNPADDAIDQALPRTPQPNHHRFLGYHDTPAALRTITDSPASPITKLALRLLILTATRSGETRLATWNEINFETETWTIPAHRMKMKREHRIPLSQQAVETLKEAQTYRNPSNLIFPSPVKPSNPLSDMSLTKILRDTGLATTATVHGFPFHLQDLEHRNQPTMGACRNRPIPTPLETPLSKHTPVPASFTNAAP